ncbi:hypothetical protein DXG01_006372 [Tephrocybe rancida]|nr:hypothetical protein DXG01_006372 [Tephrocybe rancida]
MPDVSAQEEQSQNFLAPQAPRYPRNFLPPTAPQERVLRNYLAPVAPKGKWTDDTRVMSPQKHPQVYPSASKEQRSTKRPRNVVAETQSSLTTADFEVGGTEDSGVGVFGGDWTLDVAGDNPGGSNKILTDNAQVDKDAVYADLFQVGGVVIVQIYERVFVVQGWDPKTTTGTRKWFHLNRTVVGKKSIIACYCSHNRRSGCCIHQRFMMDFGDEEFPGSENALTNVVMAPTVLFSRQPMGNDKYLNHFSAILRETSAKSHAIVSHEGEDGGEGIWRCSKDVGHDDCLHIVKSQKMLLDILEREENNDKEQEDGVDAQCQDSESKKKSDVLHLTCISDENSPDRNNHYIWKQQIIMEKALCGRLRTVIKGAGVTHAELRHLAECDSDEEEKEKKREARLKSEHNRLTIIPGVFEELLAINASLGKVF